MTAPRRTTYPCYVPDPVASVHRLHTELPSGFSSPLGGVVGAPKEVPAGFPSAQEPARMWVPAVPQAGRVASPVAVVRRRDGLLEYEYERARMSSAGVLWRGVGRVAGQVTMVGLVLSGPVVGLLVASWMGFSLRG